MYIVKVCYKEGNFNYFYPSSYGDMITGNPFRAMENGFKTVEKAETFFNNSQESFKQLTTGANVEAVKIMSAQTSFEDAFDLV